MNATAEGPDLDPRPAFRVAWFGVEHKFHRLLEIVFRHARHNRYRFVLSDGRGPGDFDIALVDMTAKGGVEVASTLRRAPQSRPIVTVGRRNDPTRVRDDLLHQTFSLHVLKALNQVVEQTLARTATAQAASGAADDSREALGRRPRALIVDASPAVRRQLVMALQQMGVDSEAVASAREAIDVLRTRRYELVFTEATLPDYDGFRFVRELKRHPSARASQVIVLTTRSSPLDLLRGAFAGCDSYLVKPVSLQSLRGTVVRQLRKALGATAPKAAVAA